MYVQVSHHLHPRQEPDRQFNSFSVYAADNGNRCHWASVAAGILACFGYLCAGPPEPIFKGGNGNNPSVS